MKKNNFIGKRIGNVTVLDYHGNSYWKCLCNCGNYKSIRTDTLKSKKIVSCGCINNHKVRHGMTGTKIHDRWRGMIQRCTNKNASNYHLYGGRGITVCNRWLTSFTNFYNDMGDIPINSTLERLDSNKNYEPSNCKWATKKEQARNRRTSKIITYNGKSKTLAEFCEKLNLNYKNTHLRLKRGWSVKRAFTEKENKSDITTVKLKQ